MIVHGNYALQVGDAELKLSCSERHLKPKEVGREGVWPGHVAEVGHEGTPSPMTPEPKVHSYEKLEKELAHHEEGKMPEQG